MKEHENRGSNRFYRVLIAILRPLVHVIFPHRVTGVENIPKDGPVLLCSNHVSMLDPVFIACAVKREIRFISKKELFDNKFLGPILTKMGMFPVNRGGTDMAAMRTCMGILKEGGVLGIFPQGHRWRKDENRELQSGAAVMALRSRVPVIPIHVEAPVKPFRFIRVRVGAPVKLDDIPRLDAPSVEQAGERLKDAIWQDM